jgi:hypothetical protein
MGPDTENKNPGPMTIDPGCPFLSFESAGLMVVHASIAAKVQAGLLTLVSSYRLCLPVHFWTVVKYSFRPRLQRRARPRI